MNILQKKLTIFYYSVFILAVLLAVGGYFLNKNGLIVTNKSFIDVFKSILIVYMLIIIPLSLKIFSTKVKKNAQIEDENEKFAKYLFLAKIRIVLISIIFLTGIIAFYIINENDYLYIAGIGAVVLFFCLPTKARIENDLFNEQLIINS